MLKTRSFAAIAILTTATTLSGCTLPLGPPELAGATLGAGLVGGALYRQRGGGVELPVGTQGARLIWAVPTGLLVAGLSGQPWLAPATTAAAYGGLLLGHGAHHRSGEGLVDEPPQFEQTESITGWLPTVFGPYDRSWPAWRKEAWHYAGMSTIQMARIAMTVAPVLAYRPQLAWAIPAGLFPAYWLGWRTPSDMTYLREGSEMGEFFTGFAIFSALMLAGGL